MISWITRLPQSLPSLSDYCIRHTFVENDPIPQDGSDNVPQEILTLYFCNHLRVYLWLLFDMGGTLMLVALMRHVLEMMSPVFELTLVSIYYLGCTLHQYCTIQKLFVNNGGCLVMSSRWHLLLEVTSLLSSVTDCMIYLFYLYHLHETESQEKVHQTTCKLWYPGLIMATFKWL